MNFKRLIVLSAILLTLLAVTSRASFSQSDDELKKKREEIKELEAKLEDIRGQKQTLSSTINFLNTQISITQARIQQTQLELTRVNRDIQDLTQKITALNTNLEEITTLLINRVNNTYKRGRANPLTALITAGNLSDLVTRFKYLQTAQKNDRNLIFQMEAAKVGFDNQKALKEQKQLELDTLNSQLATQQSTLTNQQSEKQALLEVTRNDERRFQGELAKKLAELEAIQSIIAGLGDETQVGGVNQGDRVASIIPAPSACSSGAHLHFEVAQDSAHKNPADYLQDKSVTWDNGPDGAFNFNGDWPWPINDPVRITQGFGHTFFASTLRYYGGAPHTGIDMVSPDHTVKAVQNGTLFRGAIACGGGTLRYVRVKHSDSQSTFYLHVNY